MKLGHVTGGGALTCVTFDIYSIRTRRYYTEKGVTVVLFCKIMDLSAVLPELRARFKPDQFRDRLRKSGKRFDERVEVHA